MNAVEEKMPQKLAYDNFIDGRLTKEKLSALKIQEPKQSILTASKEHWDKIAKPLDGLGILEDCITRIAAIQNNILPDLTQRALVIFCADHGIVEEGVSQCGYEVTRQVAQNMGRHASSVGRMAAVAGVDTYPVDIGMRGLEPVDGVRDCKVRQGSRNFAKEPALTAEECLQAIATGIQIAGEMKAKGYRLLATGEMGIGNTTASSAVAAALLGCEAGEVTGKGAGLSEEGLKKKTAVIRKALEQYDLRHRDTLTVLSCVGGLDIAGLCGLCIGGALYQMPVVLDGVITLAAALAAKRLCLGTERYLLASHKGREKACGLLAEEIGLSPVIDAGLKLGEGTGAVMLFPLLDMAFKVYEGGDSFDKMAIRPYERYGKC